MIVHFRVPEFTRAVMVMDVDIIPEKGSKVCIPMKSAGMGKTRKTFSVENVTYDYHPVEGKGIKDMYICIVIVNLI